MLINSENLAGLRVSFSAAFNKAFQSVLTSKDKVATTIPSTTKLTTYGWLGDFPTMREWIGEREIGNLDEKDYKIENKHFEMTVSVNRDDIEDDNLGLYSIRMEMMGQSAAEHPDLLVMEVVANGFTNKCYDGKYFYDKHIVGDKEYVNKGTSKLSSAAYGAARAAMMSLRNERGTVLNIKPNLLVVPPALEEQARLILEADEIDGTSNPWKGSAELLLDGNIATEEYPEAWFLLDTSKPLKPFIFQDRQKTKFVSKINENDENVFMRNEYIYGADGRYNAGYSFWQMAFGSTGEVAG